MIRRLSTDDAEAFRTLRLAGLQWHPEAFGASWDEEASRPLDWFIERLTTNIVWGGWIDRDPAIAGTAALFVPTTAKLRHKGTVWGVYVRPEARRTGLARALLAALISEAPAPVEELRLTVIPDSS